MDTLQAAYEDEEEMKTVTVMVMKMMMWKLIGREEERNPPWL